MTIWLVITAISSMAATFGILYWVGALRPNRSVVRQDHGDLPLFFEIFRISVPKRTGKDDF